MFDVPKGHTTFSWGRSKDSKGKEHFVRGHTTFSLFSERPVGLWVEELGSTRTGRWNAEACECLAQEWPVMDSERRLARLQSLSGAEKAYGLIDGVSGRCVGHAKIQEAAEMGEGVACAVTSVVISKEWRGKGAGRVLMSQLESHAAALGYTYMYLWTSTAEGFYQKGGFQVCERVNLALPILRKLQEDAVIKLESMLERMFAKQKSQQQMRQQAPQDREQSDHEAEHDSPTGEHVVWMRKRLVESLPSIFRTEEEEYGQVEMACKNRANQEPWAFALVKVPWQKQVGPSCGLAALRMVREALGGSEGASLLKIAIDRGYSRDGEMFNIDSLAELARDGCDLDCRVERLSGDVARDVSVLVHHLSQRSLVVIPYDRGLGNSLPAFAGGAFAHYAVLFGIAAPISGLHGTQKTRDGFFLTRLDLSSMSEVAGENLLLIGQHGMGRGLLISPAVDWVRSNSQLTFDDPVVHAQLEKRCFLTNNCDLAKAILVFSPGSSEKNPSAISAKHC